MPEKNTYFGSVNRYHAFTAVKYVVYLLLSINVYLFLQEESLALKHTFADGIEPGQIIQAFAATIDTAAWVILLLLFELETSVIDDSKIHGATRWSLHGIRGLCYIAVGYAFTGYFAELTTLYDATALSGTDFCGLSGGDYSLMVDMDEYVPLDAANCGSLAAEAYRLNGFDILAAGDSLRSVRLLGWTDVFNSAAWILVVIVLEIEVRLQLRGSLSNRIMNSTKFVKITLYTTLFAAACYWGYAGDFIDVWDASLWLFAFVFIELNVFRWQYETSREDTASIR